MRDMIILFLLASAATPAFAGPEDKSEERPTRADIRAAVRAERSESRPDHVERGPTAERSGRAERIERPDRAHEIREQIRASDQQERSSRADRVERMSEQRQRRQSAERPDHLRSGEDNVATWRPHGRQQGGPVVTGDDAIGRGWTQQPRDRDVAGRRFRQAPDRRFGERDGRADEERPSDGSWSRGVRPSLAVSNVPRAGTQPPLRVGRERRSWSGEWSRDWRDDRRYDWRHHRDRHRSVFHLGFYYDPFGWNYQRYNIGWRMWPSFYSRSHWLHDPWIYRLPPAYPGTQWIRYHGDAILVDTWTGEVVDVIYDFFW